MNSGRDSSLLVRLRGRPPPLEHRDRPLEPGKHHGQQENAEKDVDDSELLVQFQLKGEDRSLDQRDAEMDLKVQEGNQHRADEHVVAHQVHGDLARPACETGGQQIEDGPRTDAASIHDHDGLVDGKEAHCREADAEDSYRARGLDDERQERGDQKGESERIPGSFEHVPKPGLLGERRRGVLDEDETENDQGTTEKGSRHGPESRQSLADQDRAGEPEHVERDDLDVEGDDHHKGRYADAPPEDQCKRSLGRDEP